jgi:DNA invertase Pin-like site-specific DNA recombinase
MTAFIAYLRVSTTKQGVSGLGLDAQHAAIAKHVAHATLLATYTEIESGKRCDRPELAKALDHCKLTGAVLVVAKLDRLARDVAFIANLMKAGVEFIACDMPIANKLTLHILAAVAEDEAERISARTKAALAAAKARGTVLGGYRGVTLSREAQAAGRRSQAAAANDRASRLREVVAALKAEGRTTLRALAEELNARRISTVRGGPWSPPQIRNLLCRLAE